MENERIITRITKWHAEKPVRDHLPEPPLVAEAGTVTGSPQEVARVILKQLENHPKSFHMGSWVALWRFSSGGASSSYQLEDVCGTTLCVAGYAQLFIKGHIDETTVERDAAAALGLNRYHAERLFYGGAEQAVQTLQAIADGSFKVTNPYV